MCVSGLSVSLSVCQSVSLPFCQTVSLSFCWSVRLSVWLPACLFLLSNTPSLSPTHCTQPTSDIFLVVHISEQGSQQLCSVLHILPQPPTVHQNSVLVQQETEILRQGER